MYLTTFSAGKPSHSKIFELLTLQAKCNKTIFLPRPAPPFVTLSPPTAVKIKVKICMKAADNYFKTETAAIRVKDPPAPSWKQRGNKGVQFF